MTLFFKWIIGNKKGLWVNEKGEIKEGMWENWKLQKDEWEITGNSLAMWDEAKCILQFGCIVFSWAKSHHGVGVSFKDMI